MTPNQPPLDGHLTAERQSLAYHRLIAERLDAAAVAHALANIERWEAQGTLHPYWAGRWRELLACPLAEIRREISAENEDAQALRQIAPFVGLLTQPERQRILSEVR